MRKEKRWTQRDYESAYVWMRRGVSVEYLLSSGKLPREAILAADYSYQAKDYDVHGWSKDTRHERFWAINWRVQTRGEVYPF